MSTYDFSRAHARNALTRAVRYEVLARERRHRGTEVLRVMPAVLAPDFDRYDSSVIDRYLEAQRPRIQHDQRKRQDRQWVILVAIAASIAVLAFYVGAVVGIELLADQIEARLP